MGLRLLFNSCPSLPLVTQKRKPNFQTRPSHRIKIHLIFFDPSCFVFDHTNRAASLAKSWTYAERERRTRLEFANPWQPIGLTLRHRGEHVTSLSIANAF